eukprot:TRINITY_DN4593_c0_g2_i3.p1 TRINITY_DN4593_c0_g2~~TRINITY_DN4593_c0_g2_i3.p1  ORF type:complete len:3197 (+),score=624.89 TRINITY_DN4593_c0_g2_i3:110-9700(+)
MTQSTVESRVYEHLRQLVCEPSHALWSAAALSSSLATTLRPGMQRVLVDADSFVDPIALPSLQSILGSHSRMGKDKDKAPIRKTLQMMQQTPLRAEDATLHGGQQQHHQQQQQQQQQFLHPNSQASLLPPISTPRSARSQGKPENMDDSVLSGTKLPDISGSESFYEENARSRRQRDVSYLRDSKGHGLTVKSSSKAGSTLVLTNSDYMGITTDGTDSDVEMESKSTQFQPLPAGGNIATYSRIPAAHHVYVQSPLRQALDADEVIYNDKERLYQALVFPTPNPSSRVEALHLMNALESMIQSHPPQDNTILIETDPKKLLSFNFLNTFFREMQSYDIVFAEAVRQVYVHCLERGILMERVRTRYVEFFAGCATIIHQLQLALERSVQTSEQLRSEYEFMAERLKQAETAFQEEKNKEEQEKFEKELGSIRNELDWALKQNRDLKTEIEVLNAKLQDTGNHEDKLLQTSQKRFHDLKSQLSEVYTLQQAHLSNISSIAFNADGLTKAKNQKDRGVQTLSGKLVDASVSAFSETTESEVQTADGYVPISMRGVDVLQKARGFRPSPHKGKSTEEEKKDRKYTRRPSSAELLSLAERDEHLLTGIAEADVNISADSFSYITHDMNRSFNIAESKLDHLSSNARNHQEVRLTQHLYTDEAYANSEEPLHIKYLQDQLQKAMDEIEALKLKSHSLELAQTKARMQSLAEKKIRRKSEIGIGFDTSKSSLPDPSKQSLQESLASIQASNTSLPSAIDTISPPYLEEESSTLHEVVKRALPSKDELSKRLEEMLMKIAPVYLAAQADSSVAQAEVSVQKKHQEPATNYPAETIKPKLHSERRQKKQKKKKAERELQDQSRYPAPEPTFAELPTLEELIAKQRKDHQARILEEQLQQAEQMYGVEQYANHQDENMLTANRGSVPFASPHVQGRIFVLPNMLKQYGISAAQETFVDEFYGAERVEDPAIHTVQTKSVLHTNQHELSVREVHHHGTTESEVLKDSQAQASAFSHGVGMEHSENSFPESQIADMIPLNPESVSPMIVHSVLESSEEVITPQGVDETRGLSAGRMLSNRVVIEQTIWNEHLSPAATSFAQDVAPSASLSIIEQVQNQTNGPSDLQHKESDARSKELTQTQSAKPSPFALPPKPVLDLAQPVNAKATEKAPLQSKQKSMAPLTSENGLQLAASQIEAREKAERIRAQRSLMEASSLDPQASRRIANPTSHVNKQKAAQGDLTINAGADFNSQRMNAGFSQNIDAAQERTHSAVRSASVRRETLSFMQLEKPNLVSFTFNAHIPHGYTLSPNQCVSIVPIQEAYEIVSRGVTPAISAANSRMVSRMGSFPNSQVPSRAPSAGQPLPKIGGLDAGGAMGGHMDVSRLVEAGQGVVSNASVNVYARSSHAHAAGNPPSYSYMNESLAFIDTAGLAIDPHSVEGSRVTKTLYPQETIIQAMDYPLADEGARIVDIRTIGAQSSFGEPQHHVNGGSNAPQSIALPDMDRSANIRQITHEQGADGLPQVFGPSERYLDAADAEISRINAYASQHANVMLFTDPSEPHAIPKSHSTLSLDANIPDYPSRQLIATPIELENFIEKGDLPAGVALMPGGFMTTHTVSSMMPETSILGQVSRQLRASLPDMRSISNLPQSGVRLDPKNAANSSTDNASGLKDSTGRAIPTSRIRRKRASQPIVSLEPAESDHMISSQQPYGRIDQSRRSPAMVHGSASLDPMNLPSSTVRSSSHLGQRNGPIRAGPINIPFIVNSYGESYVSIPVYKSPSAPRLVSVESQTLNAASDETKNPQSEEMQVYAFHFPVTYTAYSADAGEQKTITEKRRVSQPRNPSRMLPLPNSRVSAPTTPALILYDPATEGGSDEDDVSDDFDAKLDTPTKTMRKTYLSGNIRNEQEAPGSSDDDEYESDEDDYESDESDESDQSDQSDVSDQSYSGEEFEPTTKDKSVERHRQKVKAPNQRKQDDLTHQRSKDARNDTKSSAGKTEPKTSSRGQAQKTRYKRTDSSQSRNSNGNLSPDASSYSSSVSSSRKASGSQVIEGDVVADKTSGAKTLRSGSVTRDATSKQSSPSPSSIASDGAIKRISPRPPQTMQASADPRAPYPPARITSPRGQDSVTAPRGKSPRSRSGSQPEPALQGAPETTAIGQEKSDRILSNAGKAKSEADIVVEAGRKLQSGRFSASSSSSSLVMTDADRKNSAVKKSSVSKDSVDQENTASPVEHRPDSLTESGRLSADQFEVGDAGSWEASISKPHPPALQTSSVGRKSVPSVTPRRSSAPTTKPPKPRSAVNSERDVVSSEPLQVHGTGRTPRGNVLEDADYQASIAKAEEQNQQVESMPQTSNRRSSRRASQRTMKQAHSDMPESLDLSSQLPKKSKRKSVEIAPSATEQVSDVVPVQVNRSSDRRPPDHPSLKQLKNISYNQSAPSSLTMEKLPDETAVVRQKLLAEAVNGLINQISENMSKILGEYEEVVDKEDPANPKGPETVDEITESFSRFRRNRFKDSRKKVTNEDTQESTAVSTPVARPGSAGSEESEPVPQPRIGSAGPRKPPRAKKTLSRTGADAITNSQISLLLNNRPPPTMREIGVQCTEEIIRINMGLSEDHHRTRKEIDGPAHHEGQEFGQDGDQIAEKRHGSVPMTERSQGESNNGDGDGKTYDRMSSASSTPSARGKQSPGKMWTNSSAVASPEKRRPSDPAVTNSPITKTKSPRERPDKLAPTERQHMSRTPRDLSSVIPAEILAERDKQQDAINKLNRMIMVTHKPMAEIIEKHRNEVQTKSLTWLLKRIREIYNEKMVADLAADREKRDRYRLPDFLLVFFKEEYGTQKLVEKQITILVLTMQLYRGMDVNVEMFGKFVEETWDGETLSIFLQANQLLLEVKAGLTYPSSNTDVLAPKYADLERCKIVANEVLGERQPQMILVFEEELAKRSTLATDSDLRQIKQSNPRYDISTSPYRKVLVSDLLEMICLDHLGLVTTYHAYILALFDEHKSLNEERLKIHKFELIIKQAFPEIPPADASAMGQVGSKLSEASHPESMDLKGFSIVMLHYSKALIEYFKKTSMYNGRYIQNSDKEEAGISLVSVNMATAAENNTMVKYIDEKWRQFALFYETTYRSMISEDQRIVADLRGQMKEALTRNSGYLAGVITRRILLFMSGVALCMRDQFMAEVRKEICLMESTELQEEIQYLSTAVIRLFRTS